jgi:hypothetical protein
MGASSMFPSLVVDVPVLDAGSQHVLAVLVVLDVPLGLPTEELRGQDPATSSHEESELA